MQPIEGQPEIEYPCPWSYRIIGQSEKDMRQAIAEIVGDCGHQITLSNHSAKGKYCSLNLEMVVVNESQRVGIFIALTKHHSVKIVL